MLSMYPDNYASIILKVWMFQLKFLHQHKWQTIQGGFSFYQKIKIQQLISVKSERNVKNNILS